MVFEGPRERFVERHQRGLILLVRAPLGCIQALIMLAGPAGTQDPAIKSWSGVNKALERAGCQRGTEVNTGCAYRPHAIVTPAELIQTLHSSQRKLFHPKRVLTEN